MRTKIEIQSMRNSACLPAEDSGLYYSHDLGLVAFLLSKNFELAEMDKSNPSKVLFILKRDKGLDAEVKNYWAGKTKVDAQVYFNNLKRLKSQIFSS